ncbi:MAG TPA: hypothetical protein VGM93_13300, partial [Acidimicrobiales bacterium]
MSVDDRVRRAVDDLDLDADPTSALPAIRRRLGARTRRRRAAVVVALVLVVGAVTGVVIGRHDGSTPQDLRTTNGRRIAKAPVVAPTTPGPGYVFGATVGRPVGTIDAGPWITQQDARATDSPTVGPGTRGNVTPAEARTAATLPALFGDLHPTIVSTMVYVEGGQRTVDVSLSADTTSITVAFGTITTPIPELPATGQPSP